MEFEWSLNGMNQSMADYDYYVLQGMFYVHTYYYRDLFKPTNNRKKTQKNDIFIMMRKKAVAKRSEVEVMTYYIEQKTHPYFRDYYIIK